MLTYRTPVTACDSNADCQNTCCCLYDRRSCDIVSLALACNVRILMKFDSNNSSKETYIFETLELVIVPILLETWNKPSFLTTFHPPPPQKKSFRFNIENVKNKYVMPYKYLRFPCESDWIKYTGLYGTKLTARHVVNITCTKCVVEQVPTEMVT